MFIIPIYIYVYIYIYIYIYIIMCVCMYMCVCIHVCICMYACMYTRMYVQNHNYVLFQIQMVCHELLLYACSLLYCSIELLFLVKGYLSRVLPL